MLNMFDILHSATTVMVRCMGSQRPEVLETNLMYSTQTNKHII